MDRDEIGAFIQQVLNIKRETITVHLRTPLEHQSNRLYDVWVGGRHWITKEYLKPEEWSKAPVREFQALQRLASLDLAPQPVFYDPNRGPVVVYEYLEGEMWDRQTPGAKDLAALAQTWLQVHTVAVEWYSLGSERGMAEVERQLSDGLSDYAAWVEVHYPAARSLAADCLALFEERCRAVRDLARLAPVYRFCRSDPRFANVIRRPDGRLGLVDWEDSGLRDPARELADLFTHPNQEDLLDWPGWGPFYRPYVQALRASDPQLEVRMQRYLAIFPFFWLSIMMRYGMRRASAGALAGWQVNGMPANQRLRRYLARAQAWPERDFSTQLEKLVAIYFFPE